MKLKDKINMLFKYGYENLEFYISKDLARGNISVCEGWFSVAKYKLNHNKISVYYKQYIVFPPETEVWGFIQGREPDKVKRQDAFRLNNVKLRVKINE